MSLAHTFLHACATCRPAAGSLAAEAQDSAVQVMLVCLAGIFTVILCVIFNFARKQRLVQAAQAELHP